jgi:hypothetical protein
MITGAVFQAKEIAEINELKQDIDTKGDGFPLVKANPDETAFLVDPYDISKQSPLFRLKFYDFMQGR